jgi:hypothetical protein
MPNIRKIGVDNGTRIILSMIKLHRGGGILNVSGSSIKGGKRPMLSICVNTKTSIIAELLSLRRLNDYKRIQNIV